MLDLIQPPHQPQSRLSLGMARTPAEVEEAQRLRYQVFAEEMGARLISADEEIDRDIYDSYCEHLLVRDNDSNKVIGTYRILPPEQAQAIGGYYSENEFDITRLLHLRDRMVEVGRSCVHSEFRDGATIAQLWGGLASYMRKHNHEYLIGCASISMGDGGHYAASVYRKVHKLHAAPAEYRVFPRCPLPLDALNQTLDAPLPPLIKGYLRLGAYVCGEPAWDPDFNTADLFILLPLSRLNAKYARHFMG
ncbi:MAG: GNAT family N-acetyltransferase [Sideroxydans sp.]|nr:GNAT family N-acetyltransferase [Sideroxydans sp.]